MPIELPSDLAASFWLLGLINNSAYVIMIAGAKEINEGGVALVFLCNVLPSFLCKLTGPAWFHLVSYSARINACMLLMSSSFFVVGLASDYRVKLFGVCLASLQSGLGEASILALSSRYEDPTLCLTCWSSGTGAAGVFGFAWVYVLNTLLGWSFAVTLGVANLLTACFGAIFFIMLPAPDKDPSLDVDSASDSDGVNGVVDDSENLLPSSPSSSADLDPFPPASPSASLKKPSSSSSSSSSSLASSPAPMSCMSRFLFARTLWPYMIPLFLVYFAEYAMQSGTWAAIGFPVTDESARKAFYQQANWVYQGGVFVSRSSGRFWRAGIAALWAMPVVQCFMLVFFYLVASYQIMYDAAFLLVLCFFVGLLGGAVYVNAFNIISREVEEGKVELALATASVADSMGIMLSDVTGLFLQACIYEKYGITG
eukprot:CAMPEP_0182466284 /NCGR_PEP_ID=MMETSP1319-20130603/11682_1 /TAXON_ID=172717 /ORGANISM="Bolidomonas pacifica, Strain RCC208" /LENGTH=426 /DNA_ID=CAMNT_0024666247 /DNA_START=210 /DNA_END=1487 /DNA_ORIENTATION=+